ncbi:unnamed protein product [Paramecium sonneborni]|uniref:Uncharacterized protein n=1 Tax=Paramecium sonneborni TaxID=65129 RepID=A0A8S1RUG3_9CILI|nr:unnamed protein product [Paramecium sonneborni]
MLNIEQGQVNILTIRESNGTHEMNVYRINQGFHICQEYFKSKYINQVSQQKKLRQAVTE